MVASEESDFLHGSKSRCSSKQQNKSYVAFSDLTTEVMWCHFQSILLVVLIEAVTSLPIVKGKRHNHPPSQPHGRNVSEPLLYNTLLFNSQTIIFWGSMSIIPILQMGTLRFREAKESKHLHSKAWAPNHTPKTHCLAFMMPSFALDAPQNHLQPKLQDPPFLTSFCWFTCSEFPSVLK